MTRKKTIVAALCAGFALACPAGAGWRNLFRPDYSDGDFDPAIWHTDPDGNLTAEKDVAFWTKDEYSRFELECEYNLDPAANSGVVIYCSDTRNWIPNSVEIQLIDNEAPKWKGLNPKQANLAFFGHQAPTSNPARPAGEWNRFYLKADGPRLSISLNGVKVNECDLSVWTDAKKLPDGSDIPPWLTRPWSELATTGRIGFQGRHAGARVRFRNIRIRPLPSTRTIRRLMSFNIRMGCGHDDPFKLAKGSLGHLPQCADVIRRLAPDFCGLQEVDRFSARAGGMDQAAELAKLCGMEGSWVEKIPQYGISALYRERPFRVSKVLMKGQIHTRALMISEFPDCVIANTHYPLSDATCAEAARTTVDALRGFAREKPVFLMGDFNSRPDSEAVRILSAEFEILSDPKVPTWPAKGPERTIDYIMVDRAHAGAFEVVRRGTTAAPEATDHVAVVVDVLPPQNPARVKEISAMLRPEAGFSETRAENRAFWDAQPEGVRKAWIAAGEKTLADPIPAPENARFFPRKGKDIDDSTWASTLSAAFDQLDSLTKAECTEDRGRFLPRIGEVLASIGRFPSWTGFYHDREGKTYRGEQKRLELGNGIRSERLAIVLDALRGRLDPGCRAQALKALRSMTLDTYLALAADPEVARRNSSGWFRQATNWNAACNRYFTSAILHVLDDPAERATAIEFAERSTKAYLGSFTADGLSLEGCGYWGYGFGNYMSLMLWVKAATGSFLGFKEEPFVRKCFLSSFETEYLKGRMPLYGDCNLSVNAPTQRLGRFIWTDCDYIGTKSLFERMDGFLVAALGKQDPANWRTSRPFDYPPRSWYPDRIGLLLCRPLADPGSTNRIYATIQGGYCTRPHGHHDVGSYSIAPGGIEVMGDLGNSKYSYDTFGPKRFENPLRNSYGHPVPRVDGCLQSPGDESFATVRRSTFSDAEDLVSYDLTTAYRGATNLASLVRGFRYDRASNRVEVVDRVTFKGRGTFETALTTTGTVEELGDGVFRYVSRDGKAAARCRVKVSGAKWHFAQERLPGEVGSQWNTPGKSFPAYRQAIVLDGPVSAAEVSVLWF